MNFMVRLWKSLAVGGHLSREIFQIMYGQYKILRLPQPTVSIFGGSRLPQDGEYTKKAFDYIEKVPECESKKIIKDITEKLLNRNF